MKFSTYDFLEYFFKGFNTLLFLILIASLSILFMYFLNHILVPAIHVATTPPTVQQYDREKDVMMVRPTSYNRDILN